MRTIPFVLVLLAALLAPGAGAWGQGVGGGSPTETTHTIQGTYQIPEAPKMWETQIGLPEDRIGVELDPVGPTWLKHIQRDGDPLSTWPQHYIRLNEYLVISGERSWTGWTQQIDVPAFEWVLSNTSILANGATPTGLSIVTDGSVLRCTFDPLPPGTQINLLSRLRYDGTLLVDSFDVQQFPVPEPTTLLEVLVLAALIRRR
jgi:hypothetical protein